MYISRILRQAINLKFVKGGQTWTSTALPGNTILQYAKSLDLPVEAACGGSCSCSTCHLYLSAETSARFEKPTEDEEDILDLALDVTETSRLACCLTLEDKHVGELLEFSLPDRVSNQMLS